ncbi:hypothetical protein [Halorubrum vacuolatum]|uniref:hypothetical protein n=1 Tax=Halorubrum vacuolatum TaxID=63740 RepID=UPI00117A9750|nr:hypothetical protein [Halorubrum vacuolatum]
MAAIYYEESGGEVYHIDEMSQRLLVYVYLHGRSSLVDAVEPVGATDEQGIKKRVQNQLGYNASGLIKTDVSEQMRLDKQLGDRIQTLSLTESGTEFVRKHRAELSMPADVAKLSKRVSELQVYNTLVEDLIDRVNTLEDRLNKLE